MTPRLFALILIAVSIAGPAEARHVKRQADPPTLVERLAGAVAGFVRRAASAAATTAASAPTARVEAPGRARHAFYATSDGEEIVPNPPGCPRVKFCGCGVAWKVYGHHVDSPNLDSASTWAAFPRAPCAPGRVAVWSGHVAYILECRDHEAKFWDPNSGGHMTRVHWRELPSLIVEPPASL